MDIFTYGRFELGFRDGINEALDEIETVVYGWDAKFCCRDRNHINVDLVEMDIFTYGQFELGLHDEINVDLDEMETVAFGRDDKFFCRESNGINVDMVEMETVAYDVLPGQDGYSLVRS